MYLTLCCVHALFIDVLIERNFCFRFSAGGLVTAVAPVVVECKGTWIGWSGLFDLKPDDPIPESDPEDKAPTAGLKSSQVSAKSFFFTRHNNTHTH